MSTEVYPITIHHIDRNTETNEYQFPNPAVIAQLRSHLAAKSGIPVAKLLKEQEARLLHGTVEREWQLHRPRQLEQRANQPHVNGAETPGTALAPDKAIHPTQRRHRIS